MVELGFFLNEGVGAWLLITDFKMIKHYGLSEFLGHEVIRCCVQDHSIRVVLEL